MRLETKLEMRTTMKRIFAGALAALFCATSFGATLNPVQLLNPAGSTSGQAIVSTGATTAPGWGNVSSLIPVNTTLSVPSQYASIQAACDYLGTVSISKAATITIKVANGTYNWVNIECKIPQGDQVQVIGNTTTPANVVINVDNQNGNSGFVFYRGHRLNLIDGFTINGVTGWLAHGNWTGGGATFGAAFYAVEAGSGAQIGSNIRINKMYYGLLADHAASFAVVGSGGLTINEAGDVGMLSRWGGSIDATNTTVTNSADTQSGLGNLGCGYMAEAGGTIRADGSTTSGDLVCGFGAQTGGSAWYHSVTASNTNLGLFANGGGSIDSSSVTITGGVNGIQSNDHSHIYAIGATVSGASGSGITATNHSEVDIGTGATANSNANGFTQFGNSNIFGTMNGSGNTFNLFSNGNTVNATTGVLTALNLLGTYSMFGNVLLSNISPSISSGFGTSPSIVDSVGSASFRLKIGTGGTVSSGTVGLPSATHSWVCFATDVTTTSATVFITKMTASTSTSATFTNFNTSGAAAAWAANDVLYVQCVGE